MKKLRGNSGAKLCAFVLLCVMALIFTSATACIFGAADYGLYSDDYETAYNSVIRSRVETVLIAQYDKYYHGYYYAGASGSDININYCIYENGAPLEYSGTAADIQWAGFYYINEETNSTSTLIAPYSYEQYLEKLSELSAAQDKFIAATVARDLVPRGRLYETLTIVELLNGYRYTVIIAGIASFLIGIVMFLFLMYAAGYKGNELRESPLDKLPYEIFSALCFVAMFVSVGLFSDLQYKHLNIVVLAALALLFVLIGGSALLLWLMSTAVRIRSRRLFTNTLIYRALKHFGYYFDKIRHALGVLLRKLPFLSKYVVILCVLLFVEFLYIVTNVHYNAGPMLFGWFFERIVLVGAFIYALLALDRLRKGIHAIYDGNESYTVSTEHLKGEFLTAANELNSIRDGLSRAVDERMKSERFKTELITNVSHDIKTPLTSIINYVDLLEKEQPENEKMREYIEVISRQSAKLKKLIDDLIEASKASSGALKLELVPTELCVLAQQTQGEYADKLTAAGLEPVLRLPEKPVYIMADSRHIWRVFDNLMNNIVKYGQSGTRVYITVSEENGMAVTEFKNISQSQLNISADKLMERFVRGDVSRHTSGSGLGLSIAKSLTELQNGNFSLDIDGDLFKVTLRFKEIER